jgi:hypothetical protein
MATDEARLNAFVGQMLGDMGGASCAALVLIGDRLALYRAMATTGPATSSTAPASMTT